MKPPKPQRIAVAIEYGNPDGSTFILAAPSARRLRTAAARAGLPAPDDACICNVRITPHVPRLTKQGN